MNTYNFTCLENSKLWHFIYKFEKIHKKKLILSPHQRFNLCQYVNGKTFNKSVLNSIFK